MSAAAGIAALQRDKATLSWTPAEWCATDAVRELMAPGRRLPPLQIVLLSDASVAIGVWLKGAKDRRGRLLGAMMREGSALPVRLEDAGKDWITSRRRELIAARELPVLSVEAAIDRVLQGIAAYEAEVVPSVGNWLRSLGS